MEKRLQIIFLIFSGLFLVLPSVQHSYIDAQNLSQNQGETIRFSLWAQVDPVPGTKDSTDRSSNSSVAANRSYPYDYAVSQLKELAPFIIGGMVYGWTFSYTPSDKLRNVAEYFEFQPVTSISIPDANLSYKEPWYEDSRLSCWVEYKRTPAMMRNRSYWNSIMFPKISGTGEGLVIDGIPGIQKAYSESIKNAVRSYAQSIIKNKPKEISGTVLLTDVPRLYISNGRYKADLDFFLDVDTIVPYSQF